MRTVDLGRTAAQAELLRLKRLLRRQIMRAVWGAVAAVFAIAFLTMLHVVAMRALELLVAPVWASLIVLAVDLVLLAIFGLFALRGAPDAVEVEARLVRDQALSEMKESLAIEALLSPLTRVAVRKAGGRSLYGMILAALTARFLTNTRRR